MREVPRLPGRRMAGPRDCGLLSGERLHTTVHRSRQGQQRPRSVCLDVWAAAVLQSADSRRLGIADCDRYIVRLPIAHGPGAERRNLWNGLRWCVLEVVDVGDLLLLHPGVPGCR